MPSQITEWSTALMTSLAGALALFFTAVPKVLGFLLILVVGWLVAALVEKGVLALLHTVRFNALSQRAGLADFVSQMGSRTDASGLLAALAKWFIRLMALVVAFDALGLPAVSDVLRQLLLWLPNVVVALVVLVIGGLAAQALANVVRGAAAKSGVGDPLLLAKVASGLVWAFAVVVAVNQIGIAATLVNTLFMAVVGAIALALGLSFGLGGRETAAEIVRRWYHRERQSQGQITDTAVGRGGGDAQGGPSTGGLSSGGSS